MTAALQTARATIKSAIEIKTAELMAKVIRRVKGDVAEAVLDAEVDIPSVHSGGVFSLEISAKRLGNWACTAKVSNKR